MSVGTEPTVVVVPELLKTRTTLVEAVVVYSVTVIDKYAADSELELL